MSDDASNTPSLAHITRILSDSKASINKRYTADNEIFYILSRPGDTIMINASSFLYAYKNGTAIVRNKIILYVLGK